MKIIIIIFVASCFPSLYGQEDLGDLHLIVLSVTADADLGNSAGAIIDESLTEIPKIAMEAGYNKVHKYLLAGSNRSGDNGFRDTISLQNVNNLINNIDCKPNDAIIFMAYGHGYLGRESRFPLFIFQNTGGQNGPPVHTYLANVDASLSIHSRLLDKNPRLLLSFFDCCNNPQALSSSELVREGSKGDSFRGSLPIAIRNDRCLNLLRDVEGDYIMASARPNQFAYTPNNREGNEIIEMSYFFQAFFESLGDILTRTDSLMWDSFSRMVDERIQGVIQKYNHPSYRQSTISENNLRSSSSSANDDEPIPPVVIPETLTDAEAQQLINELGRAELEAFAARTVQIPTDRFSNDDNALSQVIDLIYKQFGEDLDAKIEVSSVNRPAIQKYLLRKYLRHLNRLVIGRKPRYQRVEMSIEIDESKTEKPKKEGNGWKSSITFVQDFIGYGDNFEIKYADITTKRANILLIQSNGKWVVFLENIEVISTEKHPSLKD